MRSSLNGAARLALLILSLTASCQGEAPPAARRAVPTPSPPATTAAAAGAARNLAMGTGEARLPEPFTIEQRLLDAARRGDRGTIELALKRGASVRSKDDIGRNALFLAVLDASDLDLARWLHAQGAALDEADTGGRTALSFAAANGQLDIARYLIEHGAAVDRRDVQQRTPLFHASLGDHRDIAALLLEHGADVNVRDQFGDTPLIVACAKGYGEMASFLLAHGADPAQRDQEGRTASERAAAGADVCRDKAAK